MYTSVRVDANVAEQHACVSCAPRRKSDMGTNAEDRRACASARMSTRATLCELGKCIHALINASMPTVSYQGVPLHRPPPSFHDYLFPPPPIHPPTHSLSTHPSTHSLTHPATYLIIRSRLFWFTGRTQIKLVPWELFSIFSACGLALLMPLIAQPLLAAFFVRAMCRTYSTF